MKPTSRGRTEGEICKAEGGKPYSVALWRDSTERVKVEGCLIKLLCSTQSKQQVCDVMAGQFVGPTGDLNGAHADKEWAAQAAPQSVRTKSGSRPGRSQRAPSALRTQLGEDKAR